MEFSNVAARCSPKAWPEPSPQLSRGGEPETLLLRNATALRVPEGFFSVAQVVVQLQNEPRVRTEHGRNAAMLSPFALSGSDCRCSQPALLCGPCTLRSWQENLRLRLFYVLITTLLGTQHHIRKG